jgi:hypothetical protein
MTNQANLDTPVGGSPIRSRRRLGSRSAATMLLGVAAFVAVSGVAFAVGRTTAETTATTATAQAPNGGFRAGQAPNGPAAGGRTLTIEGTVTAVNGDTLTVTLANGQTVQVTTDSSTTYHDQAAASQGDVATGSSVVVQVAGGAPGTSGSSTATDVTIAGS